MQINIMLRLQSCVILTLISFIVYEARVIEACHAGHSKQEGDDDDDDDYEDYDNDYYDYDDYYDGVVSAGSSNETLDRAKREILMQYGDDYEVLREYFRACMLDKVTELWDWKSIVDFSILKTLWFLFSGTVECTEASGKDTAKCWKGCIDVYLRNTSSLIQPAKDCVDQYERDFRISKAKYTPRFEKTVKVAPEPQGKYSECVEAQYNEADPYSVFKDTGVASVSAESELNIYTVVRFIRRHVICSICDYPTLPSGRSKPDFKQNIDIDNQEIVDGPVVYSVTWPFSFEALVRQDARLRSAIHFCNQELEMTFRRDPPSNLGWTQWFTWGNCDAICGKSGLQKRLRACLDETSRNCIGKKSEIRTCHNRNCAYWSNWAPYTPCISTCDLSEKYSFRYCINGKIGDAGCQGERRRSKSCAVASCKVPWSQWSSCSVTCGTGIRRRTGGDSLLKMKTETQSCTPRTCPQQWSPWSPWGPCSKSCGWGGTRQRLRKCLSKVPCTGSSTQSISCGQKHSPCKDSWGEWSMWSDCTFRRRSRVCKGGSSCPGEKEDYQRCSASQCKRATWSQWLSWTPCSTTCGPGTRLRRRECLGATRHSPRPCPGKSYELVSCRNNPCFYYRGTSMPPRY